MELSQDETKVIKGLAALLLVFLHLFNNRNYNENIKYLHINIILKFSLFNVQ